MAHSSEWRRDLGGGELDFAFRIISRHTRSLGFRREARTYENDPVLPGPDGPHGHRLALLLLHASAHDADDHHRDDHGSSARDRHGNANGAHLLASNNFQ